MDSGCDNHTSPDQVSALHLSHLLEGRCPQTSLTVTGFSFFLLQSPCGSDLGFSRSCGAPKKSQTKPGAGRSINVRCRCHLTPASPTGHPAGRKDESGNTNWRRGGDSEAAARKLFQPSERFLGDSFGPLIGSLPVTRRLNAAAWMSKCSLRRPGNSGLI